MEALIQYLDTIQPLSSGLRDHLSATVQAKVLKKKEFLLRAGRVCEYIYFIEKGLLRCFYLKDETEVSSWFMKEGDVAIAINSFFNQTPSYESIQAIEATQLYYISYEDLQLIYKLFPEFNIVARLLTQRYYSLSEERLYSIRMQRAEERYNFLLQNVPELVRRVPASYIASYLSITLETLSRIKNRKLV